MASLEGIAKARVVSCEIGDRAFHVVGNLLTELLAGIGIWSADGAVLGEESDRESGNTKVMTIV